VFRFPFPFAVYLCQMNNSEGSVYADQKGTNPTNKSSETTTLSLLGDARAIVFSFLNFADRDDRAFFDAQFPNSDSPDAKRVLAEWKRNTVFTTEIVGLAIYHKVNNTIHAEGEPALVHDNGDCTWFRYGLRHRVDGPAFTNRNGLEIWFYYDKIHRDGGPAIVYESGDTAWYKMGVLIRRETARPPYSTLIFEEPAVK
jgi:hypothetical protein